MGGKRITRNPEHEKFISSLDIGDRYARTYRKSLANIQKICDDNGHDYPTEADYKKLRDNYENDNDYQEGKNICERYFSYKAKENQLSMFTEETDITENQGQDLAGALTEHDEQGSTDIQQATQPEINNEAQTIEGELITPSLTVNAPDSAPMDKQTTEAQPSKRGRKPKEGNYTHRIMIYVSPELESQINACCSALGTSITDFCVRILEKNIGKYEAEINEYIARQKKMKSLFDD